MKDDQKEDISLADFCKNAKDEIDKNWWTIDGYDKDTKVLKIIDIDYKEGFNVLLWKTSERSYADSYYPHIGRSMHRNKEAAIAHCIENLERERGYIIKDIHRMGELKDLEKNLKGYDDTIRILKKEAKI